MSENWIYFTWYISALLVLSPSECQCPRLMTLQHHCDKLSPTQTEQIYSIFVEINVVFY